MDKPFLPLRKPLTTTGVHLIDDLDVGEGELLEVDSAYGLLLAAILGSDGLGLAVIGERLHSQS